MNRNRDNQAIQDGYVECQTCGHPVEHHTTTGCGADADEACLCRVSWTRQEIGGLRQRYGLPARFNVRTIGLPRGAGSALNGAHQIPPYRLQARHWDSQGPYVWNVRRADGRIIGTVETTILREMFTAFDRAHTVLGVYASQKGARARVIRADDPEPREVPA